MSYSPSIAIHPGQAVARELDALGVSQKWLSDRTGLSEKQISQIVNGEASITAETATRLENALGGSATFWVNLNNNYQITKARLDRKRKAESEIDMLDEIPYADFVALGWMEAARNKVDKVLNLWQFFGVNSLEQIAVSQNVAFRQVKAQKLNPYALAAWLRKGEVEAMTLDLPDYSEKRLKAAIPRICDLSFEMPVGFYSQLCEILNGSGVGLVAVKNPKNTAVHGATRWIGRNPIIQLSLFGRSADKMWFSLVHEIGHILLHGKKDQFIDTDGIEKTLQEKEADDFASDILLSDDLYNEFISAHDYSLGAVYQFSNRVRVNPSVVMGRLEHKGIVPYSRFARYRTKLYWQDE